MATGEPKSATFTKLVSEAFETRNFASPVPLAGIVSEFCPVPRSGNRYDFSISRSQMYVLRTAIFQQTPLSLNQKSRILLRSDSQTPYSYATAEEKIHSRHRKGKTDSARGYATSSSNRLEIPADHRMFVKKRYCFVPARRHPFDHLGRV